MQRQQYIGAKRIEPFSCNIFILLESKYDLSRINERERLDRHHHRIGESIIVLFIDQISHPFDLVLRPGPLCIASCCIEQFL
jgi:hypothetical protein